MNRLYRTIILMLCIAVSACNTELKSEHSQIEKKNSSTDLKPLASSKKFTQSAYELEQHSNSNQKTVLVGSWIMLAKGFEQIIDNVLVAGAIQADEHYMAQFNVREIIHIGFNEKTGKYSFNSCDGLGDRPLFIEENSAKTSYGPTSRPMRLRISTFNTMEILIDSQQKKSNTRKSHFKLQGTLHKLKNEPNLGLFSFTGAKNHALQEETLFSQKSFNTRCFSELQGQYTRRQNQSQQRLMQEHQGELHILGFSGPIAQKDNSHLYVEFKQDKQDGKAVKLQASSNVYANQGKNSALYEIAFDDWQINDNVQRPSIIWQYRADNDTHFDANFNAALETDQAFTASITMSF